MGTPQQTSGREAPKHAGLTLPAWLDGSTIALLTTVVTATLILGAMTLRLGAIMQTEHAQLASDIEQLRRDVGADIEKLRDELKSVRDDSRPTSATCATNSVRTCRSSTIAAFRGGRRRGYPG